MKQKKPPKTPLEISKLYYYTCIPVRLFFSTGALLSSIYSQNAAKAFAVLYLVLAASISLAPFVRPLFNKRVGHEADCGSWGQPIRPFWKNLRPGHVLIYTVYGIGTLHTPDSVSLALLLFFDTVLSFVTRVVSVGWGEQEEGSDMSRVKLPVDDEPRVKFSLGSQWLDKI